ncbi:MAG TPA: sigma-70 family RNA polymerase sigma factor [Chromatiaceae bacterium]|nr:sigma-70 family RNA polymerase sigma factor [Chromatiaceae bacterium]
MDTKEQRFVSLVNSLSRELYYYALGLCRSPHQAEDLVQETCLRAWRSIEQLQDEKAARAWLYTILRREHARLYQRQRPESRDPARLPEIADQGYDTSTEAQVLRQALAGLQQDYREPLILQVIGGFSCDEIGKILGISASAVMTRLYRARKCLRQTLDPQQESKVGKP